jgi:SAM-dependent methyltransferase
MLALDGFMIRFFGMPYLHLTRDALIHERCRYLATVARDLGKSGIKVLDVGCGAGLALYYLDRSCRDLVHSYVGIDINARRLPKRWSFVRLPHRFCQVNLDDEWELGFFDLIWCSEVMEHIINDQRLFHRMASHLSESGRLAITTPSRTFVERVAQRYPEFGKVSRVQDGGHVRRGYELRDFEKMVLRTDLRIVSRTWLSPCTEAQLQTWGRGRFLARVGRLFLRLKTASLAKHLVDRSAESCFSLSVLLAKAAERDLSIANKADEEVANDAFKSEVA